MDACKICSNATNNKSLYIKEMMYGTGETFEYLQCTSCKCVQLVDIPDNMQKYYPENYSSFRVQGKKSNSLLRLSRKWSAAACTGTGKNPIGSFLYKVFGAGFSEKFAGMKIPFHSKILDVGTGNGQNLLSLQRYGFTHLSGIDPFIKDDIEYTSGITIKKADIYSIEEKYDLVMLNHVLEHMDEQERVVSKLYDLVEQDGLVLIRIPVNDCYSRRKYGVHWVAWDAPRHLYIHSVNSLIKLFSDKGFELVSLSFDSSEYQFWASEQYQRGISLHDERSYALKKENGIFSKKQIRDFRKKARELNLINDGNAAAFYFKKAE